MGKINSPLGSQSFDSPELKKFVIDDASDSEYTASEQITNLQQSSLNGLSASELERLAREARNRRSQDEKQVSSVVKKRIEILAGLGRGTRDVIVENITFSLRTLKSYELQEAVKAIAKLDNGLDSSFEARNQILARAICKIDGQDIDIVLSSSRIEDKLDMVRELESSVAVYLHENYVALSKENSDKFKILSDDEKDIKEAVKDLNKSS